MRVAGIRVRFATVFLAATAVAFALPAGAAAFGVLSGSVIGKAHSNRPLLNAPPSSCTFGDGNPTKRIADKPGIVAAISIGRAGAHPDATGGGQLTGVTYGPCLGPPSYSGNDATKDFVIDTPPGFVGNPNAVLPCSRVAFAATIDDPPSERCQPTAQVGVATIVATEWKPQTFPVYRLEPSPGYPASFGFLFAGGIPVVINANVRTDAGYGLEVASTDIPAVTPLNSAIVTLWGVPADPVHDADRWNPYTGPLNPNTGIPLGDWGANAGLNPVPFIQTPTNCDAGPEALLSTARIRSWQEPGRWLPDNPLDPDFAIPAPQPSECEDLGFDPSIVLLPSTSSSDSPTGASVEMAVPQNYDPKGLSTPQLKAATVTLPEGMSVNPSAADGIEGCTAAQIGLLGTNFPAPSPIRFAKGDADCPQASKVGTGEVETKLLEEPLEGDVYLAAPYDNPFHSLLALYLVFRGPGFVVKLAGEVVPDPVTGQLTTTFDDNPQLPFDRLSLDFFGGPRAPLATSSLCGEQRIEATITPWSTPYTPDASPENLYEATDGPAGAPCSGTLASRPFSPSLTAGTESPIAGGFSPLTMRITRPDGHQPLAGLTVRPPLGFTAVLKGIPYCSEARIAAAALRSGVAESASPSCPLASAVGHVLTGAGAGPTPLFTAGTAYLAGPYKGAPLSLAIVTPAVAGGTPGDPVFDLGTVVVRVALYVDARTTQITAVADPLPQILKGVPLRIRDVRVVMDRPEWGVNPTSCAEKAFQVQATGENGATASLSNRFQVAECANLGFEPRLSIRLTGGTKRRGHPSLRATLRPRPGDANISRAAVSLPSSAFLDQGHIRTVCTRVQFAADTCPAGAIYGHAKATTPLLDRPLEGPVYLRSSSNLLPDLVVALRGPESQPVKAELVGRVDSVDGGIRNTFELTPDVPVSEFVLTMQGGHKGLIVNSRNLCSQPSFARARYQAHNGRRYEARPRVVPAGCAQSSSKRARRHVHR